METAMRGSIPGLGLAIFVAWTSAANAQTQMVERSVKAAPNKDTQIGV
jgi:hypothetical protein